MPDSQTVRSFARQNRIILSILLVAVCAMMWFSVNAVLNIIYFNDPRHQDEALKGWMTPRYVVMSYDLPRPLVLDLLNLTRETEGRRRLHDIATEMGVSLDELTQIVRSAAEEHRASKND